ncbi:hypothetical protein RRSWK_02490 [Rhodopirellula sp. SWK7]|nr:hypothetical protein RRSWK_02490 [Rhodopirellula sp. SWK7]
MVDGMAESIRSMKRSRIEQSRTLRFFVDRGPRISNRFRIRRL